jgi:hypothetical protein
MKRTGFTNKRKPMKKVSRKRKEYRASDAGQDGLAYMGKVKTLPCCICGKHGPSDAHHCKDKPWSDQVNPYEQEPCAGRKSGDRDTIPLCKSCHQDGPMAYHGPNPDAWRERNGPDFFYIPETRKLVAAMSD